MIVDTGYKCPEMQTLGFFPFEISTDYNELVNFSGWSGPVNRPTNNSLPASSFSGILGPGTFYPASGSLDALTRMYWCTKEWRLHAKVSRFQNGTETLCRPIGGGFETFRDFTYCSIGQNDGSTNNFANGESFSKVLTVRDFCSYNSVFGNYNRNPNMCPTSVTALEQQDYGSACMPINPIQKFNDLLCRQQGFAWVPDTGDVVKFNARDFQGIKSPYKQTLTQTRKLANGSAFLNGYDCDGLFEIPDGVTALCSFSMMDPSILVYTGSCVKPQTGYYPELQDTYPFGKCGTSGECLTNKYGEITGYGINMKPSGMRTPCMFDIGTGMGTWAVTGANPKPYFPFMYFEMRLRNRGVVTDLDRCPVNDVISTVMPTPGSFRAGVLKVRELALKGLNTNATIPGRVILEAPLFAKSTVNQNDLWVEVDIVAEGRWIFDNGDPRY